MNGTTPQPPTVLIDRFGRRITYLRLSVTDRCDLRCLYCMNPRPRFLPRAEILTLEELAEVAETFCALGVEKIRVTGGEPLVRRNVLWLLRRLRALPGLRELALSTNGSQLERMADAVRAAGVDRVNISLDSLRPERFRRLTRVGDLERVLRGIHAARAAGFARVKLNTVVLKGRNDDEVVELVAFALTHGLDISFIEEMPLGAVLSHDRAAAYRSSAWVRERLARAFTLVATAESTGGPSRYYRIAGTDTRVGFISPHSGNFCAACNRVRVTAAGRLLLCLGREHAADLRRVLRGARAAGDLRRAIVRAVAIKPAGHAFDLAKPPAVERFMHATGG